MGLMVLHHAMCACRTLNSHKPESHQFERDVVGTVKHTMQNDTVVPVSLEPRYLPTLQVRPVAAAR